MRINFPLTRTFNEPVTVGAGNLQGKYVHTLSDGSELSRVDILRPCPSNDEVAENIEQKYNTDLQYHFKIGSRQDLVAGVGYRLSTDSFTGITDTATSFPTIAATACSACFYRMKSS